MGVLTPGTWTWTDAIPVFLLALALLFVPGAVAARLAGFRWFVAVSIAPAVSTTALAVTGIVAALAGLRWGLLPAVGGLAVLWGTAPLVGLLVRRSERWQLVARLTPEPPAGTHDAGARPGWLTRLDTGPWASLAATLFGLVSVGLVLLRVSHTPEAFPQHPDTIFHLGDAQWMIEHGTISSLQAAGFISPSGRGFYPAAFHGFTASLTMLTGAPVVVSTSCFVLAVAGVVWPLGMCLLARSVLGNSAVVVLATGVAAVAFTAYPFFLMGFGVLWPNLFGQSLLPACLALLLAAFGRLVPSQAQVTTPMRAAVVTLLTLPGLALAHPNAFITFLVLGWLIAVGVALGQAWQRRRDRPALALGLVLGTAAATLLAGVAATVVRPQVMVRTGNPGPELPFGKALADMGFFAPRGAASLVALTVIVAIGIVTVLVRHRGARWVVPALLLLLGLNLLNVAVDNGTIRLLTWPWYNNAVRLAAAAVLPAVLLAAAGFLAISSLISRPLRHRAAGPLVAMCAVLAGFLVGTHGYVRPHQRILERYFHPSNPASSWASDAELRALHTLSHDIPRDAVVAANAWNGGTYLYVVSGRHLLIPTEKAAAKGDRTLLASRLDQVGQSPTVCAAAKRQHVTYAITGGRPFAWASRWEVNMYAGVDGVGSSSAFTKVRTVGEYTLWKRTACAT